METYGFCKLSSIPVRADASDRSEMVNQLLFGETFEIVDAIKNWKVIRGSWDKYEGFIDEKQFVPLAEDEYAALRELPEQFPVKPVSWVFDEGGHSIMVGTASLLSGMTGEGLQLAGQKFRYEEAVIAPPEVPGGEGVVAAALKYLNAPYLWGGRSAFGIDCSGLVQNVFRMNGIKLNRDASYQSQEGETLSFISEAQAGDLAFFDNEEGEIIHVGIMMEAGKIIHSSGQVRVDSIDHQGIFDHRQKKYTHKLRLIKRLF